jgi:hypothetical protein
MTFPVLKGYDNYVLAEPPSCPNNCSYEAVCDSEDSGICRLDEARDDERYQAADRREQAARDDEDETERRRS